MPASIDTSLEYVLKFSTDMGLRRRYQVVDETLPGNMRLGLFLEVLDKLAEETALKYVRRFHADAWVVTAAIDRILIRDVVDITRDLVCHARINHVGRSSVEIGIRVEQPGAQRQHIASCYFTMVARRRQGEHEVSAEIPQLPCQNATETKRFNEALARREEYRRQQAARLDPPSRYEYMKLASLHGAQEETDFAGLLAGDLVTSAWERMYPENENVPQKIFGGYLVRRAYELSSICSERVAPERSILAAVNRINFFHPVRLGDKLHFTSRVVYTSGACVCVEASIERLSRDRASKALSNSCLFTFISVNRDLEPRPVPPIYPTTYADDTRYLVAHRSHQSLMLDQDDRWRSFTQDISAPSEPLAVSSSLQLAD
jgi:acyl-coenzyme A thioesterase 9